LHELSCSIALRFQAHFSRGRFVRERLDGLYDEPRPGTPRQISDQQIEQVIVQTLEATPRGETHWSSRGMAKATDVAIGLSSPRSSTGMTKAFFDV
jgi:transposase